MHRKSFFIVLFFFYCQDVLGDGGRVETCSAECPPELEPVCADCNGEMRNFTNPCSVRRENDCYKANCHIQRKGTCTPECAIACTREFDPKCSWNGKTFKTFNNPCLQNAYNICHKDKFVTISNCPCREPSGQV